ncbi:transporter [Francisellaceae bacterium]|nr:transporter [Francisellaceae bacterium]
MNTKYINTYLIVLLSILIFYKSAFADGNIMLSNKPLEHAPIGVKGDHVHKQNEWMLSLRYGQMYMGDNYNNTEQVGTGDILSDGYMAAPENMTTYMVMGGLMYGVTDYLTLMVMTGYLYKDMLMTTSTQSFSMTSQGLSDTSVTGMIQFWESNDSKTHISQNAHFNVGVSIPTGSINQTGDMPMGNDMLLGYPMQLGSGTFDPILALTYNLRVDTWAFGSQFNTILRLYDNYKNYHFGNEYLLSVWAGKNFSKNLGVSLRAQGKVWERISGSASGLNPNMSPLNNPDVSGGERIDLLLAINYIQLDGILANNRLALEFGVPVYQRLNGPQLGLSYMLSLGWQWSF